MCVFNVLETTDESYKLTRLFELNASASINEISWCIQPDEEFIFNRYKNGVYKNTNIQQAYIAFIKGYNHKGIEGNKQVLFERWHLLAYPVGKYYFGLTCTDVDRFALTKEGYYKDVRVNLSYKFFLYGLNTTLDNFKM